MLHRPTRETRRSASPRHSRPAPPSCLSSRVSYLIASRYSRATDAAQSFAGNRKVGASAACASPCSEEGDASRADGDTSSAASGAGSGPCTGSASSGDSSASLPKPLSSAASMSVSLSPLDEADDDKEEDSAASSPSPSPSLSASSASPARSSSLSSSAACARILAAITRRNRLSFVRTRAARRSALRRRRRKVCSCTDLNRAASCTAFVRCCRAARCAACGTCATNAYADASSVRTSALAPYRIRSARYRCSCGFQRCGRVKITL